MHLVKIIFFMRRCTVWESCKVMKSSKLLHSYLCKSQTYVCHYQGRIKQLADSTIPPKKYDHHMPCAEHSICLKDNDNACFFVWQRGLRHSNILTFVFKALNKISPTCFHNYFTPNSSVHRFGTCQVTRGDLFKSFKNTNLYGLKSIKYFGSKLWNTLPLFIRVSVST